MDDSTLSDVDCVDASPPSQTLPPIRAGFRRTGHDVALTTATPRQNTHASADPAGRVDRASLTDPASLADRAVRALIAEACLTPKPALVDQRGSGAHRDLDLDIMLRSARSLRSTFQAIAETSAHEPPSQVLRERLGRIGRAGEAAMLYATGGSNAHRGAIWIVGLLCAGAAWCMSDRAYASDSHAALFSTAAHIARFDDRYAPAPATESNGARIARQYGARGARGEARDGFPHVTDAGLPALQRAREAGLNENDARLEALLSIMARLEDTCLLHRGGRPALEAAQHGASQVFDKGGLATDAGRAAYADLDRRLLALNASPGGAADLLAATLFVDSLRYEPAETSAPGQAFPGTPFEASSTEQALPSRPIEAGALKQAI
jgi:triphosphoribosyl-dephospho-CoA synthase